VNVPLDLPGGLKSDDTTLAASPAWVDGSNARFRLGRPQSIGGWESLTSSLLTGACRSILCWTDNANNQNIAFGTNSKLHLWQGGMLYDITPSSGFTAGAVDGTGSAGWGTGAWGVGTWGTTSASDYFPLTQSLAPYGQTLMMCPRGQTIFRWSNVTASPAVAVTNAPANVTYMLTARRFLFALGCNQESGGVFNPLCIRHSDLEDPTGWTTSITSGSTSREYVLPGGGRIVAGRNIGADFLVWTSHKLFAATYVGQIGQVWAFEEVGDKCGLIGPGAAVVVGQTAFWTSPDRQFHSYTLGGAVQTIECPIREDYADNLSASQGDKVVASSIAEFDEIRFDYPDSRDGNENSRYVALCIAGPDAGSWYRGEMARTAMVDAGPSSYPIGTTVDGNVYWHEKGQSADGAALSSFVESADIYLDQNNAVLCRGFWPDIAFQTGAMQVTITSRMYPQGDVTTYGPLTIAPGDDRADFKAQGRLFRVRIEANAAPSEWRLGRIVFDAKLRGRK
jgi:hypothetical protein